ncbi:protein FAR1-RELATED SEQUENCE 6-like [Cynara cardunculus var. scolymus]|uniref:protein FAR1-RELATED SEQUENCE 6-like n=1 Tax=Cynara cardunculus var. scolymus TaxID=59895 RepID=UPI000D62CA0E|nr:protein FAR1-RELATED SEQUENCE 6-like [Cynara cardunculus var. scolymus]
MIIIKLVDSKRWRIIEVELLHNHPVSPEVKRFYKSHKRMILASKKGYQLEHVEEIHTIKLYHTNITAVNHAGYSHDSNLDGKEVRFFLKSSKHLDLKGGDVHAVYNYFCRMKLTNPNFFYLMDLNHEGQLQNVFWADARSKVAYNYFYDTILIDTTILTYKYEIPIVSFVGVNHHRQYVLLGCAFLGDDSLESFTWMFKTWLTCMMDQPPQVITSEWSKPLHALSVLNYNGIEEVPSQYIVPRWSRDYKVRSKHVDYRLDDLNNGALYLYNHLSQRALRIVEEGATSKEHYNVVEKELEELFDKLSLQDESV